MVNEQTLNRGSSQEDHLRADSSAAARKRVSVAVRSMDSNDEFLVSAKERAKLRETADSAMNV